MTRVLFVDDEPRVLEGLRDLLRRQRREWDMVFALGGEAALAELAQQPFDVVVSDMRMPGMDGPTLLAHVQERCPDAVRIVLSGETAAGTAVSAVPVAHQFLNKPCDAETLRAAVERASTVRRLLAGGEVRGSATAAASLPSAPRAYAALGEALADPDASVTDVAGIVAQDVAMCAKVLQLVNSGFFGLGRPITRVDEAVAYLGLSVLRDLVLSIEAFAVFEAGDGVEAVQRHSLLVGRVARRLVGGAGDDAAAAFTAGMLHDVGKLVLASRRLPRFDEAAAAARETGEPLHVAERRLAGVTHAEVGAYLLGLWGLPYPIVDAVAYHHEPSRSGGKTFDLVAAVHVADALTRGGGELDHAYVESLGAAEQLPRWQACADEEAAREEA